MTAEQERAAVVAWLRRHARICDKLAYRARIERNYASAPQFEGMAMTYRRQAEAIERGDHHAEARRAILSDMTADDEALYDK